MNTCSAISLFLVVISEAYDFPKVRCTFTGNDTECKDVFQHYAMNSNTKLIYVHLKDHNELINQNETRNPLVEFIWINSSSEYLLSYPDDFHPLTFGILADNIFEIDVAITMQLNETKQSIDFLFSNMASNLSFGEICHRDIHNHSGRDFFENFNIWIGYDYLCFAVGDEIGKEVYKLSTSNILISVLGFVVLLWFPLVFVIMDQNKAQMKRKSSELKSYGKTRRYVCKNDQKSKDNRNHENDTDESGYHHTDTYDQGDVPYGLQRMFIACFHSNVSKEVPIRLSLSRFTIILVAFMATTAGLLITYEMNHIPPDIKDYPSLHPLPNDIRYFIAFICVSCFYYVLILCFYLPVALKDYTYSLNVYGYQKNKHFLTKIKFCDVLGTSSEEHIFHNFIDRFLIIFRLQFWILLIAFPFRMFKQQKSECNDKGKKCFHFVMLIPSLIAILFSIIFQLLWAFPLVWCFSAFILNFLNMLDDKILRKRMGLKKDAIPRKMIKLVIIIAFPALLYACQLLFFHNSSITAAIPVLVKVICYTCFIALPQMSSTNFRILCSILTLLSYCMQLYIAITNLYKELLKSIFRIHEEIHERKPLDAMYVKIDEFDYVTKHVFPFRIQLFYLVVKLFLALVFFFVALEPYFYLNFDHVAGESDEIPLFDTFTFYLFLLSPSILEFWFNSSPESKVLSNINEIKKWIEKWQDSANCRKKGKEINHSCMCAPCCEGKKCGKTFTFFIESIFGCCFKFTEDKFCQICSILFPILKSENASVATKEVQENPENSENVENLQKTSEKECDQENINHHVFKIKFPGFKTKSSDLRYQIYGSSGEISSPAIANEKLCR